MSQNYLHLFHLKIWKLIETDKNMRKNSDFIILNNYKSEKLRIHSFTQTIQFNCYDRSIKSPF